MAIDGGSVEIRFEGDTSSFKRSIEEAESYIDEFGNKWNLVEKEINGGSTFTRWEKDTTTSLEKFANTAGEVFAEAIDKADSFVGQLGEIGKSLKTIGSTALTAGATAAAGALVKMAKGAIQDTSALENTQIQMIGLTHSVEDGNKAMVMAVKYFKNNPFNRFEVTSATKSLIQFGAELDEIPDLLDKLGKVALSTGASIDTMAYYYQRNISDGRIATRDLLQMQNQGIPIFQALAEQIGVTSGAVREMAAKGKIAVEDFQAAFDKLVDDKAMERFNATLSRQVDRFKGRMSNMRAALAGYTTSMEGGLEISENGLYRAATRFLKTFADIMDSETGKRIYEGFEKIGNAIAKVIDKITSLMEPAMNAFSKMLDFLGDNSELLIPILGGLVVALGRLGSFLPGIGPIIDKASRSFGGLFQSIKGLVSTHPILSAFMALLGVGFMDAMKNDEEFRKTIGELTGALKEMVSNLMEAVRGVLPVFVNLIKELASSGVIKGVLTAAANAISWIAKALASIPPEILASLMSFFVSLKLLNANPIMFAVMAIGLLIQYIKELGGIGKIFENLPDKLEAIGHNIMTGLFNGVKEGATKVVNFVKSVAKAILDTFRNMFGIHSPSTVMYEMGMNMGLGLANGIEDSTSAVELAMSNLAEDILKLSEKIISNKVDFGILDINAEYKEWKKVSKLFTQGSEQYNYAIEQMEDARKKANLKILELQRSYNDALDNTIKKISSMYGLFDEVNLGGSKNSSKILKNLDQQVAKMQEWAEAQKSIANLGLDDELVKELQAMGVDATGELSAIAQMTSDELGTLNDMWLKKQSIANEAGVKQMEGLKNDTLDEINELKRGIDGTTVGISDAGGRLVENIAEGVYGAMPTLESALSQVNDYIAKAQKELAKNLSGEGDGGIGDTKNKGGGDDGLGTMKKEIQASLEKMKSMLPNVLLGAIGAVGAVKFGPKILKAITDKLFSGGTIQQGLGSLLGGGKGGFSSYLDQLLDEAEEGSGIQKALMKLQSKINKNEIDAARALDTGRYDDAILDSLDPNSDEFWKAVDKMNKNSGKSIKKAAGSLKETQTATATIAKDTTSISNSIETTGQGMSKAQGWMKNIQEGAKSVIYIAGAIAAVAGALWITYNALKDVDFGKLAIQLIAMGLAVAEFGVLAALADKFVGLKGIIVIVGIAVDIAAVAVACRVAYDAMKDMDWDIFGHILGSMAGAIGVFGLFGALLGSLGWAIAGGLLAIAGIALDMILVAKACRDSYEIMKDVEWEPFAKMLQQMSAALGVMGGMGAVLGLFVGLEALGWMSIMMVCDELIQVSRALVEVDKNVPEDFTVLENKLKHIKKTLEIINGLDLGTVIGMMVTSWSAGPVERIMEMYVKVAEALNKISTIELDQKAIENNLDYIKSTLESIDAKTDVISGWLEASALDMEASTVENAGRIVIVYGNMVDALDKLANFKPDEAGISKSLLAMVGVITLLRNQSYGNGGIFNIFNNMETVANDVDKIKSIVKNYLEMVPTMQDLGKSENEISDSVRSTVEKNIENIKSIVHTIGSVDTGGWIDQKESDMGKIQSILNKFTELIPVANQIASMNIAKGDENSGVIKRIKDIKTIVKEIGSVDTGGWIDQKESDMGKIQSILNKFTEIAQTCGLLDKYPVPSNAQSWIQTVRHLVWEIGQINQDGADTLDAKANIIEKSKVIATKLGEFADIIKNLESTDKGGVIESLTSALNQLISGVSDTLAQKAVDFENIGVQLGQSLANGVSSQNEVMSSAGASLQSAFWWAINDRVQDEFYQGVELANTFKDGIQSVSF